MPTMEAIIAKRRKDAQQRGIFEKAEEVAKRLGEDQGYRRHRYDVGGFTIQFDGYGPNLYIYYGTQGIQTRVYYESSTNGLEGYRPDVKGWLEELERLYTKAIPTKDAELKAQAERERRQFIEMWGEDPE